MCLRTVKSPADFHLRHLPEYRASGDKSPVTQDNAQVLHVAYPQVPAVAASLPERSDTDLPCEFRRCCALAPHNYPLCTRSYDRSCQMKKPPLPAHAAADV